MRELQLEEIIERIERAFGDTPPLSVVPLGGQDLAVLKRVLGDDCYQLYLQDQHNRQIIVDYLTNAVMLGIVSEEQLASFADQLATEEGRSALSLHMLMSSVEEANNLAPGKDSDLLKPLKPGSGAPPYMKLVP